MIGKELCQSILNKALSLTTVEDADFFLSSQEQGLTRFAGNSIHQNVSHSNAQLHIRAVVGKRLGRAVTNDLSEEGIAKAVGQAEQNASLMPEDPDFLGLPDPDSPAAPASEIDSYNAATASFAPEDRAQSVGIVCGEAEKHGLNAYGACRTGAQEIAVASTRGARAYHAGTFAGLLITVMSDTSSGWAKGGSWRVGDIKPEELAHEATDKALRGKEPHDIEPGEYTVVLDHYAVDDILGALSLYGMGAQAVQERRSWMNGLEGETAMHDLGKEVFLAQEELTMEDLQVDQSDDFPLRHFFRNLHQFTDGEVSETPVARIGHLHGEVPRAFLLDVDEIADFARREFTHQALSEMSGGVPARLETRR